MHLVIFEGKRWDGFAPLSLTRPSFLLHCGMTTLLEKQVRFIQPSRLTLWVRPELADYCQRVIVPSLQERKIDTSVNTPLDDEQALLLSSRTLLFSRLDIPDQEAIATEHESDQDHIPEAVVKRPGLTNLDALERTERWNDLLKLPRMPRQSRWTPYLWDLISWNEEAIVNDSVHWRFEGKPHPAGPYHMIGADDVMLAEGVKLQPGAVLDASKGPIAIDRFSTIGANSYVQGPCYIGPYATVMPLTIVRCGTSIGPHCKIGGEVSNSIMVGYSNKSHNGYLGDSYVGEWVNMGAGTTTSNLKLTYGEIGMHVGSKTIPTDRRLMGSLIGDHVKTSIDTRLNTGSYIGCCTMLAGSTLTPNFVPSFTFWKGDKAEPFRMEKALEVARRMYDRRDKTLSDLDRQILQYAADIAPTVEN